MYLWLGGARDSSLSPLTQSPGPGAAVSAPSLIQWAKSTWSCCHRPGIWRGLGVLWQSQSLLLCSLEPMAVSHPAWAPDIRCTGWLCRCGPHGFLVSGDFLLFWAWLCTYFIIAVFCLASVRAHLVTGFGSLFSFPAFWLILELQFAFDWEESGE